MNRIDYESQTFTPNEEMRQVLNKLDQLIDRVANLQQVIGFTPRATPPKLEEVIPRPRKRYSLNGRARNYARYKEVDRLADNSEYIRFTPEQLAAFDSRYKPDVVKTWNLPQNAIRSHLRRRYKSNTIITRMDQNGVLHVWRSPGTAGMRMGMRQ